MTKNIVDVQQVERLGSDHCSRERTGAHALDVSDYLTKGLLQSTVQFGLQRMNVIKCDELLHVSVTWTPVLQSLYEQ